MSGARIVLNSRYIHIAQPGEKAGKFAMTKDAAVGLVEYIGTREGVSLNLNENALNKIMDGSAGTYTYTEASNKSAKANKMTSQAATSIPVANILKDHNAELNNGTWA